jgi:hypothetical protein
MGSFSVMDVDPQPSLKIGDTMPRQKVRHPIFDFVGEEEALLLLRQLDWKKLEQCLGRTRLTKDIRTDVVGRAFVIRTWRNSHEVKQKIIRFKKRAQKLRQFLGKIGEPISKRVMKSPKTVEADVFESPSRFADPNIELVKKALDKVIAASDVANSGLTHDRSGLSYEKWLAANGFLIREEFKKARLPYKVRKDTDKMWDDDQNSPFVKFYLELLKQIGMPWPSTTSALAAALHSVFRVGKARKKNCA